MFQLCLYVIERGTLAGCYGKRPVAPDYGAALAVSVAAEVLPPAAAAHAAAAALYCYFAAGAHARGFTGVNLLVVGALAGGAWRARRLAATRPFREVDARHWEEGGGGDDAGGNDVEEGGGQPQQARGSDPTAYSVPFFLGSPSVS